MATRQPRDEWLLATLEALLSTPALAILADGVVESYWEAAVRRGLVADEVLLEALAARFRMKVADLALASPRAVQLVPEQLARRYRVVPLDVTDSVLDIATSDPHDLDCERTLAFATGRTVRMSLASPLRIAERIEELYRGESPVDKILEGVAERYETQPGDESDDAAASAARASERPIVKLVDHLLTEAITSRASDIHLEPEEGGFAVRYRIDGVLRQVMTLPRGAGGPLVSRIKIMAALDIADRMRPQDGRTRVDVNGRRVDLRVSTLPAAHGEKVVVRILDARGTLLSLDSLGLGPDETARVRQLLGARDGIILVTGPTGSGKTTTLYSALREIQNGGVNIITVEDPVEYRLQGIVQVQVNEKSGLTFASALRSILRQDPDVVLIGEIRDRETAQIAVQASLTGHLVFSTLHTNDAVGSIARLADIGIEHYKVGSALKGVVAQRLLRKLCPACRELSAEPLSPRLQPVAPPGSRLYRATGCPECTNTGYRGRLAVTEVLIVTPELERRISGGESAERLVEAAVDGGMRSLWQSGLDHVLAGETSIEELLRVVEIPAEPLPKPARPSGSAPSVRETAAARDASPRPGRRESGGAPTTRGGAPAQPPAVPSRVGGQDAFELIEDLGEVAASDAATVLLVEDEAPLRAVLRELLEREGFAVVEAGDGIAALDEVDRAAPSLIVLDLSLPRLDGYGVLKRLRAKPATAHLPVLVLTAHGDEDSEVRVFESGANDFLTKPCRPRALGARLRSLLKRGLAASDA